MAPLMNSAFNDGTSPSARTVQKLTRWLMLMNAEPADALRRARIISKPAASADEFMVYCAVVASDSRMRLATISRSREVRGPAFVGAACGTGMGAGAGTARGRAS